MPSIRLSRLTPRFFSPAPGGEVWGADILLEPGFHVLCGASGRGKSTLLREVAASGGLPGGGGCGGAVLLEGFRPERRPFSFLDQGLSSLPGMSCRDNLVLGLPGQAPDFGAARGLATRLGLGDPWARPCGSLSRGELQRLLAIRVLLQDSEWILLDEPCAHLDPASASLLLECFFEAAAAGRSVLMSSLDPGLEAWPAGSRARLREWRLS